MFLLSYNWEKIHAAVEETKLLNLTSLGYIAPGLRSGSKPDQPSMLSSFFGTENLSGSNSFGRSQKYGDLWRLYICSARIYHKSISVAQSYSSHFCSCLNSPKQIYQSQLVFHIPLLLRCIHLGT